jgi:DnaJ-class molecular chaperone
MDIKECSYCNGTGEVSYDKVFGSEPCPICRGMGVVYLKEAQIKQLKKEKEEFIGEMEKNMILEDFMNEL